MAHGDIDLDFGDGHYRFNVARIGQAFELEQNCDSGVSEIFERLRGGNWRLKDVREVIRLGLIGGGSTPVKALQLVKAYVDERPWMESRFVAVTILAAALIGMPEEKVGKRPARRTKRGAGASSDPRSTAQGPQSDSRQDKLTNLPSGNSQPVSTDSTKSMAETIAHQVAV